MKKKNKAKKKPVSKSSRPTLVSGSNFSFGGEDAIYRDNIKTLEKTNPVLAGKVRGTTISSYELIHSAPGKAPTLRDKVSGLNYYNPVDPLGDAADQVNALNLKNTRLAIFLGIGLGYELIYYLKNIAHAQNTNFMLIIEKDLQVFKAALKTTDLSTILSNDRISFMVGLPEADFYVDLRNYLAESSRFMFLKAMKPVYHSSSLILNKDYYMNALKQLRESGAHQVLLFGNDPHDSIIGVENMLKNINEIVFNPGINLLLGKFKSKPAVIVSTGPSLNKNKHLLKGLEDKALIIAADASLKVMLEIDVKPHLVTSLERGPEVATLIDRIKEDLVKEVYFAACPVVCNEVYQAYPGPRIIVYRNFDHFKWLGIERGILNIQLSSGNMSFKVAEALGCDPIILIGQDLAFSREGDTHAEGATYGAKQDFFYQENKKETMGNDGKPIMTTDTWYSFLKAYDLDVAAYKGTCVNSTEGGAYIQGTEVMTFQGAIDKFIGDDFHPLQIVKDHLANFSTADAEHDYINVLKLIEKTALDMQCIVDQCKRGTELYNKNKELLIKALSGVSEGDTYKNKVDTIHREVLEPKTKITTDYELTYQLFFMHVLQSFNIKFEMEMIAIPERHEKLETSLAEITLRHSEWYSVVSDLSKILLDLLEKTRQKLLTHKPEAQNLLRRASL